MTLPLSVDQSTVHIDFSGAKGSVLFVTTVDILDGSNNIIVPKGTVFDADLVSGEATLNLPANISLRVFVRTNVQVKQYFIVVPLTLDTVEFANLVPRQPSPTNPPFVTQDQLAEISDVPWRVLFYYGIPESVNGSPSLTDAAEFFTSYDYVVFGEGLQFNTHPNHVTTGQIITMMKAIKPSVLIFGYINIGVSVGNESIADLQNKMDLWKAFGVDHIFMDLAGYDFDVPRSRLNTLVSYAHSLDMATFVNAFDPDDVMGSAVNATFNPSGTPTEMGSSDFYLIESWVVNSVSYSARRGYNFMSEITGRADASVAYRESLGVTVLAVNGIDYSAHSDPQVEEWFHACQTVAAIYSIPFGVNTYEYSSVSPNVNIAGVHNYDTSWRRWYNPEIDPILNGNTLSRPDIGMTFTADHTTLSYSFNGPHIRYYNDSDLYTVLGRLLVPANGSRIFITELPFATDLTSILVTGDRFAYPKGHSQEGEVYRWNGSTWIGPEVILTALPNSVIAAIQQISD